MNNKIVLAKNNSAIFLATLLVLGTIATVSPSFMLGTAQADSYLEMENNYEKSYGNDNIDKSKDGGVIVKKINCNNINVNVNGLELDGLPPFLGNLTSDGDADDYVDTSAYGNGEKSYDSKQSGYDNNNNSFKFICINNNNNTVVVVNETTTPEPLTCEECFTTVLTEEELDDLIEATEAFTTLEEICNFLDTNFENEPQRLFISEYLFDTANDIGISAEKIVAILDCLEEIYGVDFPRP